METGLYPIRHRRAEAALNYLNYVIKERPTLPWIALQEAQSLAVKGDNSWLKDLHMYLGKIAPKINFELGGPLTVSFVSGIRKRLGRNLQSSLKSLASESERIPLINERFAHNGPSATTLAMRLYLTEDMPQEVRKAITRLVSGDHPLAIEALRRMPAGRKIRREWRVCRFCHDKTAIEDEGHVLLKCTDPRVVALRTEFYWRALEKDEAFEEPHPNVETNRATIRLLLRTVLLPRLAGCVHTLFRLCEDTPTLLITSKEEWMALE